MSSAMATKTLACFRRSRSKKRWLRMVETLPASTAAGDFLVADSGGEQTDQACLQFCQSGPAFVEFQQNAERGLVILANVGSHRAFGVIQVVAHRIDSARFRMKPATEAAEFLGGSGESITLFEFGNVCLIYRGVGTHRITSKNIFIDIIL